MSNVEAKLKDISKNCSEGNDQCNKEITKTNNAFANFKKVFDLKDIASRVVSGGSDDSDALDLPDGPDGPDGPFRLPDEPATSPAGIISCPIGLGEKSKIKIKTWALGF